MYVIEIRFSGATRGAQKKKLDRKCLSSRRLLVWLLPSCRPLLRCTGCWHRPCDKCHVFVEDRDRPLATLEINRHIVASGDLLPCFRNVTPDVQHHGVGFGLLGW